MKALIFDSSSLISLTMNGLLYILKDLKKIFKGKFIITRKIKFETVDRPINVKRFELEALKIQELLKEGVLEMPSSIGIDENVLYKKTEEIEKSLNKTFSSQDRFIELIQKGEAECLALSILAREKGIDNLIIIDERTTRILVEKPENLKKLFETKLHTEINFNRNNLPNLKNIKIIRSAELAYLAYKKNLVKLGNGRLLDALLYAVKFKGCSISQEEIEQIKKL